MKHIKTFEAFIGEETTEAEYKKQLQKDVIDKEARTVAAGEEEEEKEEEVDADETDEADEAEEEDTDESEA